MPQNIMQNLNTRPPIVVVMGHVDHGKTTLLDYIRKTSYQARAASSGGEPRSVAEREAGGITQSIGAYEIEHNGRKITFIDTPGHEAFTKMRARGAFAADLAILVVAADEGVKPQTLESVNILQETETPYVVAVTKTDKPNADVEKVKNELTAAGVLLEGYGGKISYEPVSAKTGDKVKELLDLLLLAAELENLAYDPAKPASGYILEARIDRRRGMEGSVIVKDGTLRQGEPIATPSGKGKVKILENFLGESVKELVPSAPALVLGWEELPQVGEEFITGEVTSSVVATARQSRGGKQPHEIASVAMLPRNDESGSSLLNIILKAGDAGSLEALSGIIKAMTADKPAKIVSESVGDVSDNDVKFAISTSARIFAFKSRVDKGAKTLAENNKIKIIASEIIYELVRTVEELLTKKEVEVAGELEILAVFNQEKPEKQLVGGKVVRGSFKNKAQFEINRGENAIGTGRVLSLQSMKKDATEVEEGKEAGLIVNSQALIQVGDRLVIRT